MRRSRPGSRRPFDSRSATPRRDRGQAASAHHQAGTDPAYFGVLFIVNNNSIGLITPPVGGRPQRGVRRVEDQPGGHYQGRVAVHDRPARRALPDDPVPVLVTGPAKWFGG
jgi:hypothetical protein